jgi:hypothetical protein
MESGDAPVVGTDPLRGRLGNTLAVAGLVCSAVAVVLGPVLVMVMLLWPINYAAIPALVEAPGLVLSALGLFVASRRAGPTSLAVIGVVLGLVALASVVGLSLYLRL